LLAGADLTVLHAFWQPGKVAPILAGTSEEEMADRRESLALDAQADLHRFLGAVGLPSAPPPRAIVREGAPEMVIREEVGRLRPDLVLMGTGQRGALSAMLLGSVAEAVLSLVECDVLVVPPGNSGERTSGASPCRLAATTIVSTRIRKPAACAMRAAERRRLGLTRPLSDAIILPCCGQVRLSGAAWPMREA
jgi:nucleotide-binding universal stress UspA family protein